MKPVLVLALVLISAVAPAIAATHRLDDSASVVQSSSVAMKWDSVAPSRGDATATLTGEVNVLVRLNVMPWRGQAARIYLTLPVQPEGALTATWTTFGPLLPGALRAGERALVYAGPIPADLIEDTLRLVVQADGRRLSRATQLQFSFEIDVETP